VKEGDSTVFRDSIGSRGHAKDEIRPANLAIALAVIRRSGSISRGDLALALHLGRTTVFELLNELVQLGLVRDSTDSGSGHVGRPSMVVAPSDSVVGFTVNPESDALTVGRVTLGGSITDRRRFPTPAPLSPSNAARIAADAIRDMLKTSEPDERIGGIGVAVPGQVVRETGHVIMAPRLGWRDADFGEMLSSVTGLPVWVDNNARLVTEAEHRLGAAKDFRDLIYIFSGAGGLGGGIVLDNRLLLGSTGFAGELGHLRVSESRKVDFLGLSGTFEALVQRDELLAVLYEDDPTDGALDLTDSELNLLVQRSESKNLPALAARHLRVVGEVSGNLANIFNPQAIILGGFLGSLYRRFPDLLDEVLAEVALPAVARSLKVQSSIAGPEMAMLGAAELVFAEVEADPLSFKFRAPTLE
jgi:predicted NBD/HSP70 family sugar kinase